MKSKITIEVDFENGNLPTIQILSRDSDDVRDKLIKAFLQSFQHTSRWCKMIYMGNFGTYDQINEVAMPNECHKYLVVPVTPNELAEEIKLMQATLKELGRTPKEFSAGRSAD